MIQGKLFDLPDGCRGFDANTVITPPDAAAFVAHGYHYAVRYIRRSQIHAYDLSAGEANGILAAGLGLMAVQHVESATAWVPTRIKGAKYGAVAGAVAVQIGLPVGTQVWCDLEGVAKGVDAQSVVDYANQWYSAVSSAGYLPGLYVGWSCGLSATDLYKRLRFSHYWGAYNLNADEVPVTRGLQMQQHAATASDRPRGITYPFDVNVAHVDHLGGRPVVLARDGWNPNGVVA